MSGPLPTWIPHPTVCTYNITSLSQNPSSNKGVGRRNRVLRVIGDLLGGCDILCLQETKLGRFDGTALKLEFPNHLIFHNNLGLHKGGTLIMVSRRYGGILLSATSLTLRRYVGGCKP